MKEIHASSPQGEDFLLIRPICAKFDGSMQKMSELVSEMTEKRCKKE
jgi:hypothetical protein